MNINLTFDSNAKKDILNFFNKEINEEGLIVETNTKEAVISLDGLELHEKEFAGIKKGSEIFLKNDLISVLKLSEEK